MELFGPGDYAAIFGADEDDDMDEPGMCDDAALQTCKPVCVQGS